MKIQRIVDPKKTAEEINSKTSRIIQCVYVCVRERRDKVCVFVCVCERERQKKTEFEFSAIKC